MLLIRMEWEVSMTLEEMLLKSMQETLRVSAKQITIKTNSEGEDGLKEGILPGSGRSDS